MTGTATPMTSLVDLEVVPCERMTVLAVGLSSLPRSRSVASQNVGSMGHGLEMVGPDAAGFAAEMVDLQSACNGLAPSFVCPAVSTDNSFPSPEVPVALASDGRSPEPTALANLDLLHESLVGVSSGRHA